MGGGALILALAAGAAAAQDLPAQYAVQGVAADDVLNVRAEPSAESEVLGSLGPYRINVEVLDLSADGRWGWIGLPEGNGWVSMAYLAPQETPPGLLPLPLVCGGTEPFWSLGLYPGGSEYVTPEGRQDLTLAKEEIAPGGFQTTLTDEDGAVWTMLVQAAHCSDGMSDRIYGWQGLVFRAGGAGNMVLSGCCTLDDG